MGLRETPEFSRLFVIIQNRLGLPHLVTICGLLLYLPGLGKPTLHVWDESIYASAAQWMVLDGFWIVPHMQWGLDGITPFLQKPPLAMWLQGVTMSMLGTTAFAARLPAALSAVALAVTAYYIGQQWFDARTGFASALILLVLPAVYLWGHSGRSASLDVPLTLFGTLLVWWTVQGRHKPSLLIPAAIAGAAAALIKGLAAGVFLIILGPLVAYRWRDYLKPTTAKAAIAGLSVLLPWPIYAYLSYPSLFIDGLFLRQVRRAAGGFNEYGNPLFEFMNYPYFKFLFTSKAWAPVVPIAIVVVMWSLFNSNKSVRRKTAFLAWWAAAVPLTFALVGGNHGWYIVPMAVPVALLSGRGVELIVHVWNRYIEQKYPTLTVSMPRYVILGIITIAALTLVVYPIIDTPPTSNGEQEQLGEAFAEIPSDSTVYIAEGMLTPRHFPFEFYSEKRLARLDKYEDLQRESVKYAVVPTEAVEQLEVSHTRLATVNGTVAIEVDDM